LVVLFLMALGAGFAANVSSARAFGEAEPVIGQNEATAEQNDQKRDPQDGQPDPATSLGQRRLAAMRRPIEW
jgi:hypothetical protein